MALPENEVKVIQQCKVAPPPGSVPTTTLPLTFFDMPWLFVGHMQSLFFYEFPHPMHHFFETILPTLKHSLSLTLQHFFPLAANLVCPPPPAKPHMLFTDGDSSVSLTIAESAADFNLLLENQYPQPVGTVHPLVPKLAPPRVDAGSRVGPVMALQITVFPNSGICIGLRVCHVASDGRSFEHFLKFWTLVSKSGGDIQADLRLPSHDRTAIKDPDGGELAFLKSWWSCASTSEDHVDAEPIPDFLADKVRATFLLSRVQIERLKRWVANQLANDENSTPFHVSSFVASCALLWVCLAKSKEIGERNDPGADEDDDEPHHFVFVADCRSRLEYPLPSTYFGNCLTVCFAPVKRKVLLGDNGVVAAAKAIGREVGRLEGEALKEFGKLFEKHDEVTKQGKYVSVSGSTKLGFYEVDFGWGKPKNVEFVHIEESNAISLVESRDEKGGVELGVALRREQMSRFSATLKEKLAEIT